MRLRDSLDRMRVPASVAGGAINAELYHRDRVDLAFAPGCYQRFSERELADHLASLARVLHAEYVRRYFRALSEAFERTITKEPPAIGWRDQAYVEQREQLVAEGRSRDDRIVVTVRGMRAWHVWITAGALRVLDERQFSAGFGEAAQAVIRDQFAGIRDLKTRIYG
ncbi:hypothetical protein GCM10010168_12290 [Actinoplanes ianthinogenes]|uniref:Uncharacterized protein n=1 Tax=Actinoplanes ianthinogenes TaxID=122358 RepID=A0ABM7LYK7_9ACTN|nr:hypothetical protein [Actinoplanes ianthinogenes]BCJ44415.1 hypothetical protein Aiant_50720 [Actinoplanes ianthinogenes]GGQ97872.1 hypothetical protein GCM10010168_12290 [Actinoplanes ianthinogenes]